jgi:hypothetical protein
MFVADVTRELDNYVVYIVTNQNFPWQIVMICPCGCDKILYLNLLKELHPSWTFEVDKANRISLRPSVHRIVGCQSHFYLTKGEVIWCGRRSAFF